VNPLCFFPFHLFVILSSSLHLELPSDLFLSDFVTIICIISYVSFGGCILCPFRKRNSIISKWMFMKVHIEEFLLNLPVWINSGNLANTTLVTEETGWVF